MTGAVPAPVVAVLGASGLIGESLTSLLLAQGYAVVPVARRFTSVQHHAWRGRAKRFSLVDAEAAKLRETLAATGADVVVNCIGILQDAPGALAVDANRQFVDRLLQALRTEEKLSPLLVHISVPGEAAEDRTDFSRGKRAAEAAIRASGLPYVVIRPGFVVAEVAFGGSALMRALAALPFALPRSLAERPFAVTDVRDIARTVAFLITEWQAGRQDWRASWDVMEERPSSVGAVLARLGARLAGPQRRIELPGWMLAAGAAAGDAVSRLGWRPPVRSTALAEMRRGVTGDPGPWIAATGLSPLSGPATLETIGATVQERWFARMYLLKAMILGILAPFWILSGLIALTVAFTPAVRILTDHGFDATLARAITVATSFVDIAIGLMISNRRTCRLGLVCGIALSALYMISATIVTPAMWIDPLGALVKIGPAIVLMMVGLAVFEDR